LNIGDWVDGQEKAKIEQQFHALMRRLGASSIGVCCGVIPGNLKAFLSQGAK